MASNFDHLDDGTNTSKDSHQGKAASRTKMFLWISMAVFLDLMFFTGLDMYDMLI